MTVEHAQASNKTPSKRPAEATNPPEVDYSISTGLRKRLEGLELNARLEPAGRTPWREIQGISLKTGACVDWLRIDGAISGLFGIERLEGMRCPMAVPLVSNNTANLITFAKP